MKRILITGSSGLVGTHLVNKCLEKGHTVYGVDIKEPVNSVEHENFTFINSNLINEENLKTVFDVSNPDVVLNTFGVKGSPIRAKTKPVDFLYPSFKINTELIDLCAKKNIWLVFVSSVGVYSPAEKFVEGDVWNTLPSQSDWFPSWSKRMGEMLLDAYKVQYDYNKWSIIRPANIFGEYDDFSGNGTVIATMVKKIYESNGEIDAWGDGSPIRDFVYAGDVADAIIHLFENDINDIVNFGSGVEVSIRDLVNQIIEISGKDIIVNWDITKPNGDLRRLMDVDKQKKYGILPKTKFIDAISMVYKHYIKNQ